MSNFLDNLSFVTFCNRYKNTFYLSLSFYFRFFGNPRKMRVRLNGTEGQRRNKIQVLFYFIAVLKFYCIRKLSRRSKIQNSIDLDPTQKRLFLLNLMIKATKLLDTVVLIQVQHGSLIHQRWQIQLNLTFKWEMNCSACKSINLFNKMKPSTM